jgi:hypothetical protein
MVVAIHDNVEVNVTFLRSKFSLDVNLLAVDGVGAPQPRDLQRFVDVVAFPRVGAGERIRRMPRARTASRAGSGRLFAG